MNGNIHLLEIVHHLNEKVKNLTLSQKFFLSLAGILLKEPQTLILDEPTALLNDDEKKLFQ